MMFGPEYCFPFRHEGDEAPPASVIAAVVEAAYRHEAAIRIEASCGGAPCVQATIEICRQANARTTVGLLAPSGFVETVLRDLDAASLSIVTVSIGGADTYESLARLAKIVLERERVLEFDVGATSDFAAEQLDDLGAWRTLSCDDTAYRLRGGDVAITGYGHVELRDSAGGLRRSETAVQDVGLDAALATLGLDPGDFRLSDGCLYLPSVFRVPEPGGRGRVAYWSGGTQAFGHYMAQEEARAGLGFHSSDHVAYEQWLENIGGITADTEPFPAFGWNRPDYGLMVSDGEKTFVRPPARNRSKHPALVFAAWIAAGRVDEVAYCLGVRADLPTYHDGQKVAVDGFTEAQRKQFSTRASALLALAVQILAMSRIPRDQQAAVAAVLPTLATQEARRAAQQLSRSVPDTADRVYRKFRSRTTRSRLEKGRDPAVAIEHLKQALTQLADIFGEHGGRNG